MLSFVTNSSLSLNTTWPEVGHGAKKEKSYTLGWGDTAIKWFTSGLLIISCIHIKEPNEKPETQHWL